jgi:cell wall-associated NlpC family hydrolase
MTEQETVQRQAVVAEARSWLGTRYHHEGRVKGAGTDCGQLLILVYAAVGLIPGFDTGHYPFDWALHRDAERYMGFVAEHAHEIPAPPQGPAPQPGDLALWKFGRCFSHGAIVVAWPQIIHAQVGAGVVLADAEAEQRLNWVGDPGREKPRDRVFFTLWK